MSVFRRRNIAVALFIAACLYFFISVFSSYMTVKELSQPRYTLISPIEPEEIKVFHQQKNTVPSMSTGSTISPDLINRKIIPSVFSTSTMLQNLLKNDAHDSRVLSNSVNNTEIWENQSVFNCICGRVSDNCVCCGPLGIPSANKKSPYKSLILFADGDSDSATFCVNITYLPKKQEAKMTGFLTPSSKSSPAVSHHVEDGKVAFNLNTSRLLVLFDSELVPLASPPAICAENSKEEPVLMLCSQLSLLYYGIDPSVNHQTVFSGCLEVFVVVNKHWTIVRYPKTCFRAHRGAAGDVDQAAAIVAVQTKLHATTSASPVIKNAPEKPIASSNSVHIDDQNKATSKSERNIPVTIQPELKVKVPISINDAHHGIP